MPGFDVLRADLPLFQNTFIEASAGTGKTFVIEQLVAKLLMHPDGPTIDQILVVTFTRAATLELKERIRATIESYWKETGEARLARALASFDEARILTIHSSCFQTLREHALAAGIPLNLGDESAPQAVLEGIVRDYFRECPPEKEEIERLLGAFQGSMDRSIASLCQKVRKAESDHLSFAEVGDKVVSELKKWNLSFEPLLDDLLTLAPTYKNFCDRQRMLKSECKEELEKLAHTLICGRAGSTLLRFLPSLKLKKEAEKALNYPGLIETLLPLAEELFSEEKTVLRIAKQARSFVEKRIEEEDLLFFEDLLRKMHSNLENESFAASVRSTYRAVLIDEFQDTDPIQWKIFSTLFFHPEFSGPVYVVGDPKQAIYRFRDADIYTYLTAKKAFGERACVSLSRNWRSEPALVRALNFLFTSVKDFFPLPKWNEALSCPPVDWDPSKEEESGHFEFCLAANEEEYFPFIVETIRKRKFPLSSCAILVKDRFQAERFLAYAKKVNLPAITTRSRSLVDSIALPTIIEWLQAVIEPSDRNAALLSLVGPLYQKEPEVLDEHVKQLYTLNRLLYERGVFVCFMYLMRDLGFRDALPQELYSDCLQLIELVAKEAPLVDQNLPYLRSLLGAHPESEKLKARQAATEDAVQILTIHVSKGLEFDAVFPLGLILPTPKLQDPIESKESEAEKMRALYVALTRARKALFVPVLEKGRSGSPMTLFLEKWLQGRTLHEACAPCKEIAISRACDSKWCEVERPEEEVAPQRPKIDLHFPQTFVHSFSSLAKTRHHTPVSPSDGDLPPGAETGRVLHKVFEELDFRAPSVDPLLKGTHLEAYADQVKRIVEQALSTPLKGFTLAEVDPKKMFKELEFLMPDQDSYLKGFIDLGFEHKGIYYLLDWKTNLLASYDQNSLENAMEAHDYFLQAKIYSGAFRRYLDLFNPKLPFGGIFYFFLRGLPDGVYLAEEER